MFHLATENSIPTFGPNACPAEVVLPEKAFMALNNYALRDDAEPVLRYSVQRGKGTLRIGPYVGLLQASGSVRVKVLPKINSGFRRNQSWRLALLRMLKRLMHFLPLPDCFQNPLGSGVQQFFGQGCSHFFGMGGRAFVNGATEHFAAIQTHHAARQVDFPFG